ncbi:hypothetical protein [Leifsonia poae]|uniref:Uncharacterized protein n=1 Tax=Leifsonia poae TaxID=110933 RepID=A0A9W6HC44_9MICO|nr:hypothetical protein [Leifsonia poae]GLJ77826.1 hypothetical protein GCM10017584_34000 [Leifsonia poae]
MKKRSDAAASDPGFGIGVQVHVIEPAVAGGDDWVGEPTGVIVAPGAASLRSVNLPAGSTTNWMVAFDEPQFRRDGRGPFERASIEQALLVAADPIEG